MTQLASPLAIKSLVAAGRIIMPPMATNYADEEGLVSDRQIAYYVARARGGAGYLTVEHTGILPQGKASPRMLLLASDRHKEAFRRLIAAVHQAGRPMVVQLNHAGRQTASAVTGEPIVGPSPIPCPTRQEVPRELAPEELAELARAFAAAARRAKEAGADGVEIHMAHGYLLCSFLSPFSNRRADQYGGSLEKRARFPVEVLKAVRGAVGEDFAVLCRLSGDEYVPGGLDLAQTREIAKILAAEGADALHVSACNAASGYLNHPPYYVDEGVFLHLAQGVKEVVDIPVIAVGRIRTPQLAAKVLAEGRADLVAMGRALIADPELPNKARAGRFDEIIPCVSCNHCIKTLRQGPMACTVNPFTGNEARLVAAPAEAARRVWVVGGGPGGLLAAALAAERGHRVTLFEQEPELGGRLRLAAKPPRKETFAEFLNYLLRRVAAAGVGVEAGVRVDPGRLAGGEAQALILATGSRPAPPPLPGLAACGALWVDQALAGDPGRLGPRVLIVGGGGVGAETADYLAERGHEVTLVEMLPEVGADLVGHLKHYLGLRLREKGVTLLTGHTVKELFPGGARLEGPGGPVRVAGFATVVLALGSAPEAGLAEAAIRLALPIWVVGDAHEVRGVQETLLEAAEAGLAA